MNESFFPTTLNGWLVLAMEIAGILFAVWGWAVMFIRKPIVAQVNGLGERTKSLEEGSSLLKGKVETIERHNETASFENRAAAERMGKLEGRQERLEDGMSEAMSDVRERLGGIEASLKILVRNMQGGRDQ